MSMLALRALTAIAVMGAALLALVVTSASAQYPSPEEPISVELSDPEPGVGETITLNIVVQNPDAAAERLEGPRFVLAGGPHDAFSLATTASQQGPPFSCTSDVTGGQGATVSPEQFETDSEGRASLELFTGTAPGTLTVSIVCGDLSTQVVVPVGDEEDGDDGDDGDGAGVTPGPPDTGVGTAGNDASLPAWVIISGLVIVGGSVALGLVGRARWGRTSGGG